MMKRAYNDGVHAASIRFGVREAGVLATLAGIMAPFATQAALRNLAPKAMPAVEHAFDVPFKGLKTLAMRALPARTPEEILRRAMAGAPAPGGMRDPAAMIARSGV